MLAQCLTQGRFNIHPGVLFTGIEAFAAARVLQHAFKVECLASLTPLVTLGIRSWVALDGA